MSANLNLIDLLKRKQPRQPWDERIPDGRSVDDLLRPGRENSSLPMPRVLSGAPDPALREQMGHPPLGPQPPRPPGVPENAHFDDNPYGGEWIAPATPNPAIQRTALGVPNGDIVELLKRSAQPPPPAGDVAPSPPPNARIGTDLSGLNEQQRQQAKVELMRATPAGQKVRQHGDFLEAEPPEQSPSRVKNALLGLLLGTAQGGLAGGIAGAGLGAIKPGAIQELLKQKHLAQEEGVMDADLDREGKRIDTDLKRARIEEMRRPPEAKVYAPELRTDANGNLISVQGTVASPVLDKQGNPVKGRVSGDGETVEIEVGGRKLNVTPAQALTYFGQIGAREDREGAEQRERDAKRQAAEQELRDLEAAEIKAGEDKNTAYAYLEQIKKNVPDDEMGRADIAEARRNAEEANKTYRSFDERKREARRKIQELSVQSSGKPDSEGKYRYTLKEIQERAKQAGKDVNQILETLRKDPRVVIVE